jgi:hypothetical protein
MRLSLWKPISILVFSVLFLWVGQSQAAAPSITNLSPNSGAVGTAITISGSDFGTTQGSSTVSFNGTGTTPTSWSDTSVVVMVPSGATTGDVVVNVGVNSNGASFTVVLVPSISSISPTSGPVSALITIAGSNFGATQGASAVSLNGTAVSVLGWSDTSIVGTVPLDASSGLFSVTVNSQQADSASFAVTPTTLPPGWSDQDISPDGGAYYVFESPEGGTGGGQMEITVGSGPAASATYANNTFTVTGSGQGMGGAADGLNFAYEPLSGDGTIIARVVSVQGGTQAGVMIRESLDGDATEGTTFSNSPYFFFYDRPSTGASLSNQGYAYATLPYWIELVRSGNTISSYYSPDGVNWAQSGSSQTVTMTQNVYIGLAVSSGSNSSLATATFDNVSINAPGSGSPAPVIASLSATTGSVGHQVIVSGSGFGASQTGSMVILHGVPVTINTWSGTSINITIPTGATSGPVVVSVAPSMNDSNPVMFGVTSQPLPTPWLDQDIGQVGETGSATYASGTFTVNGSGAGITGTTDGMHFVYQPLSGDATIIARVVSVQGVAGVAIRETLTGSSTEATTYSNSPYFFFYDRPSTGASLAYLSNAYAALPYWIELVRSGNTISSFSSADGMNWTQMGTNQTLTMAQNVYIGLAVSSGSNSSLATATFDNVSINAPGSGSPAPVIASLSITSGMIGTPVTITGTNFGPTLASSAVTFNGTTAIPASWSSTSVTVTVPSGATSGNVTVAVSGVVSNGLSFTVDSSPPVFSVAVSPSSATLSVGTTKQFSATGTFGDGSTLDLTASVTWTVSDNSIATISNLQLTQGVAAALSAGSVSVTATFTGVSGSANVTVVPMAAPTVPSITNVSPTAGSPGSQVIITGTGFGAAQGTGCVYVGTALGVITSWGSGQIVATVAPGSLSGIVQVLQGSQQSNSIAFPVNGPTISSISPTNGLAGTSVTILGSGFAATQGNGQVRLGSVAGVVTSWSDTQVTAAVAARASSGAAQILQNGTWSNPVIFTVNTPQITNVNPNAGALGTQVTIAGSGFGATQGTGIVWLGSTNGVAVGWSNTQVTATVASGAVSGIVRIQQNGVWSNAQSFSVPALDGSSSLTMSPNVLSMVVGDTRTIHAVNRQAQSVAGLTWTSSNTTVASLSADDPPVITALAVGQATITAGNASADLTVYSDSLPTGTILWSDPGDGSGVTSIVPAVPSPSGAADVFAFQASGSVEAIASDGTIVWSANVGTAQTSPDFQGGLVVVSSSGPNQTTIQKLDGITGSPYPAYSSTTANSTILVHTDGTIFTGSGGSVVGIDPLTGTAKFSIPLLQSESINSGNCGDFRPYDNFSATYPGQGIIAGDGFAYFPLQYGLYNVQKVCNPDSTENGFYHRETHARLLRVGTDGSSVVITVGDTTETTSWECVPPQVTIGGECPYTYTSTTISGSNGVVLGALFTKADQGVVMSGSICTSSGCTGQFSAFNAQGMTSTVSTQLPVEPILQRPDGSFVGYVGGNMAAFDLSGNVAWSVPSYSPLMATPDGGVVAQSTDGVTTSTFDANGNATGQLGSFPILSWKGAYELGSVHSVLPPQIVPATTFAAVPGGNFAVKGTSLVPHTFALWWCGTGYLENGSCSGGDPVLFSYVANTTDPDPNFLQDLQNQQLSQAQVVVLNSAALAAYRKAFAPYAITIQTPSYSYNILGDISFVQDYTVDAVGTWPTPSIGLEFPGTVFGRVYYLELMNNAQVALGYDPSQQGPSCGHNWCNFMPAYPLQGSDAQKLTQAIGTAIGNAAAHETGHYLAGVQITSGISFPNMDCGLGDTQANPAAIACESDPAFLNEDNFVYNFWSASGLPQYTDNPSSNGGQFFYINVPGKPIHWSKTNSCWLQNYSAPNSCKSN